MQTIHGDLPAVVSARVYGLILTSPRLKRMLLPQGIFTTPYEILDYQATLTLEDPEGTRATFRRSQHISFLQDGVSGILDHAWGDGVALTSYHNDAGRLEDSFRDEGRRHLVIGLRREMGKGEELKFKVERTAMFGFTGDEEWLETTIEHPVRRLSCGIVFPKARPCQAATLYSEGAQFTLPIVVLADGRSMVRLTTHKPRPYAPYTIRWSW